MLINNNQLSIKSIHKITSWKYLSIKMQIFNKLMRKSRSILEVYQKHLIVARSSYQKTNQNLHKMKLIQISNKNLKSRKSVKVLCHKNQTWVAKLQVILKLQVREDYTNINHPCLKPIKKWLLHLVVIEISCILCKVWILMIL